MAHISYEWYAASDLSLVVSLVTYFYHYQLILTNVLGHILSFTSYRAPHATRLHFFQVMYRFRHIIYDSVILEFTQKINQMFALA